MGDAGEGLILIGGVAAFFFLMGCVGLGRPEQVLSLFGTPSLTREGRSEVRAVYGGFGIVVAALLLAPLWFPALRAGVLVTVAVSLGGMAAGRLISAVVDGSPKPFVWLVFCVEVLLAGALALALSMGR